MLETFASVFGMSVDDVVKIMVGLGAFITTVLAAAGKFLRNMYGAKKRTFVKIRRLEDIVESLYDHRTTNPNLEKLLSEMKIDQRDASDERDAE